MTIRKNGKILELEQDGTWKTVHQFPENIFQCEYVESDILVSTETTCTSTPRNIWLLDHTGAVKWQIEEAQRLEGRANPYSGFRIKGKKIIAISQQGAEYVVDPATGKVKLTDFNRF